MSNGVAWSGNEGISLATWAKRIFYKLYKIQLLAGRRTLLVQGQIAAQNDLRFDGDGVLNSLKIGQGMIQPVQALIALCVKYVYNHNDKLLRQSLLTLVAFLVITIGGFGFSQVWDINSGAATEYLEVFISVGLMSWALLVNSRIKLSQPAQKNNQ